MKNTLVLLLCLACSVAVWSQSASKKNGVKFVEQPFETLVSTNNNNTKPIMVWIYVDYCGGCMRMQHEVWDDPSTGAFFNRYFVSMSINLSAEESMTQNETLFSDIPITILPTIVFFRPDGRYIESATGYKNKAEMRQLAKRILEKNRQNIEK